MPELPEVEVLVRYLRPALARQRIREVHVRRAKVLRPTSPRRFQRALLGAAFQDVTRRGKYLLFTLRRAAPGSTFQVLGHLGMTGRIYVQPAGEPLPKHAAVVLSLGARDCVFEDTRYFGRLTLDLSPVAALGPEPFSEAFSTDYLARALSRSAQPIKVKLLDQRLVAGVGNIYASEALFRARLHPRRPARSLRTEAVARLHTAIRTTLQEAIDFGSTVPLDWSGTADRDRLFYYGRAGGETRSYLERLRVYDRAGQACEVCGTVVRRLVQAARSTFFCPHCQPARRTAAP